MTLAKKNSRRIVAREKKFRCKLNAMFEPE